jgi:Spy/CpxP family protein refolding chaperone
MRTFFALVLAFAVPAGFAVAEEKEKTAPIVPETTTAQLLLLRQKSVQKELKLSDETAKKVMEFTNKESDEYGKALKDLKDKERDAKFEELEKANEKFLQENLSADQRKRLEQITLQVTGLHQLNRPEVVKELNLTDEQVAKLKDLQKEARKGLEDIITGTDRAGKTEKLAKLREETNKKILAVLTDEQKAKVKEIVGEPFKGELMFEEPD